MINLLYKVVDTCPCVFESVHDGYKTREMSDEVVSNNPFMLKYCLDRYETKKCVIKLFMIACQHLNLFMVGLLPVECLNSFVMLYSLMMA